MYEYITLHKVYYYREIRQPVIELRLLYLQLYDYHMLLNKFLNIFMQTDL